MTSTDVRLNTCALHDDTWQVLGEFALPSEPDHEHPSADQVMETVRGLDLPVTCLERLEQSVTEAIRNAVQHGNPSGPEAPVLIRVLVSNLEARQAERQSRGGWGFFMIERAAQASSDLACCAIELFVYREGGKDGYRSDGAGRAFSTARPKD